MVTWWFDMVTWWHDHMMTHWQDERKHRQKHYLHHHLPQDNWKVMNDQMIGWYLMIKILNSEDLGQAAQEVETLKSLTPSAMQVIKINISYIINLSMTVKLINFEITSLKLSHFRRMSFISSPCWRILYKLLFYTFWSICIKWTVWDVNITCTNKQGVFFTPTACFKARWHCLRLRLYHASNW